MVLTESTMVELGSPCPPFALPDIVGNTVARDDFEGEPLLVIFMCNHCPYVKHIAAGLAAATKVAMRKGVAVVGISSNDVENYPADSPSKMRTEAKVRGYDFPYLYDESQDVARAFNAACTPDFFLYNEDHRLVYRGRFDGSTPGNGEPVTGNELESAIDAMLAGLPVKRQIPSIGCNIKWKPS